MPDWSDWYSGSMAPPMRAGSGTLAPAPNVVAPMSVDQMYEGIYPASQPASAAPASRPPLNIRQVQTVAVDPFTGAPIAATGQGNMPQTRSALSASDFAGPGAGLSAPSRPGVPRPPNEVVTAGVRHGAGFQSGNSPGPQYRLMATPPGLPSVARDNQALAAATRLASANVPLPRPRPALPLGRAPDPGDGGLFGIPMSKGMMQSLAAAPPAPAMPVATGTARSNPQVAQAMAQRNVPAFGTPAASSNGYVYVADGKGGWIREGKVNPSLTPSQQYAAANAAASRPATTSKNPSVRAASSGGGGETPYVNSSGQASWTSAW